MGILTTCSTAASATTTPPPSSISSSSSSLSPQHSPTFPPYQLLTTGRSQFDFDPKLMDSSSFNQTINYSEMMNNFSSPGIVSSTIPTLPSPPPNLPQHLKTEPCTLPPVSRSDEMLGLDVKSGSLLGKWKDDIESNGMNLDVKSGPLLGKWKDEIDNGMNSPDWHNNSTGFMGPNHHQNQGSDNNLVPLPASSSSPGSHQHVPQPSLGCSNSSVMADSSALPPLCAGCRLRIVDKFYLCAVEAKWHTACLKCAECGVELENQLSCFERDGQIYCKDDYVRIFANKCFRCSMKIQPSDLVMKVHQCLFHVECFRCKVCDSPLKKGDYFGMYEDVPYCQLHYELIMSSTCGLPKSHIQNPNGTFGSDPLNHSPIEDGNFMSGSVPSSEFLQHPGVGPFPHFPLQGNEPPPPGWFPGPPDGFSMGDFPYDNNNEPRLKKQRGRKKRKVETFEAMNGYLEAGGYPPGMDGPGGQGKTKRARTSFKHHQLRIMKAHFNINQNPDSRELKMLSQKTQLDKKVLQVWFQNARAKWRRTKANGDGTNIGGGQGGTENSSISGIGGPNSSSSGLSGPEDADLGGGASPSSDCSGPMIPCY